MGSWRCEIIGVVRGQAGLAAGGQKARTWAAQPDAAQRARIGARHDARAGPMQEAHARGEVLGRNLGRGCDSCGSHFGRAAVAVWRSIARAATACRRTAQRAVLCIVLFRIAGASRRRAAVPLKPDDARAQLITWVGGEGPRCPQFRCCEDREGTRNLRAGGLCQLARSLRARSEGRPAAPPGNLRKLLRRPALPQGAAGPPKSRPVLCGPSDHILSAKRNAFAQRHHGVTL